MRELALWCQRFSPLVAVEEAEAPESLLLDIVGCGHLFGGEAALARRVIGDFRRDGYLVHLAVADTIGAAWAVTHFLSRQSLAAGRSQAEPGNEIVLPGRQIEALAPLPVEGLRLSADVVEALHAFDLRRIGQLLELPRSTLPSRFGPEVLRRLDQALGNVPELLGVERPIEPVEADWPFEFPVADRRIIEKVLGRLLEQVLERLRQRQLGVQRLEGSLGVVDHESVRFTVGLLRASDSASHLFELLRLHFERVAIPGEISAVALRVLAAAPVEFRQELLFEDSLEQDRRKQLPLLLERLSGRLGEQAVLRPDLRPDVQPEFAWRYLPWIRSRRSARCDQRALNRERGLAKPPCVKRRPVPIPVVSIVPGGPPVRLEWGGQNHVVARWWGPERIETGWWRGPDVRRDYYLVETATGERFWLFRTIEDESWFLHGTFA